MALRNIRSMLQPGLGALPKQRVLSNKNTANKFAQMRRKKPQMIQPMPIRPPQNLNPMPINRPPILNKGPGSGPMPIRPPSIGRPPAPILGGNDYLPQPPSNLTPPQYLGGKDQLGGGPPSRFGPDSFFSMFPDAPRQPEMMTSDMTMYVDPITGMQQSGSGSMSGYRQRLKDYLDANPEASSSYYEKNPLPDTSGMEKSPFGGFIDPNKGGGRQGQQPILGRRGQQPISIGGIGGSNEIDPTIPEMINENPPIPKPYGGGSFKSAFSNYFKPPGMEGAQEIINQQLPFGNLGSSLSEQDPIMSPGGNPNFNERGPAFDLRQMPAAPIVQRPGMGRPPMPPSIGGPGGDITSIGQGRPTQIGTPDAGLPGMPGYINLDDFRNTLGQGVGNNPDKQAITGIGTPGYVSDIPPGFTTPMPGITDYMNETPGDFGDLGGRFTGGSKDFDETGGQGRQPISIGGPGGGITSIGQIGQDPRIPGMINENPVPFDPNTPGLPRLPGGQQPVPPQDFGFGPGIRPSEITGPNGQFIGSGGVTPPKGDALSGYLDPEIIAARGDPDDPYGLLGGLSKDTVGGRTMEFRDTDMNGVDDRDQPDFGGPSQEYLDREARMLDLFNASNTAQPTNDYDFGSQPAPTPGLTPAPVVTPAPVIEPAPVTPPQSTTVAGNDPAVTGGMPAPGVTPPVVTPPVVTPPVTDPATTPAATTPAATTPAATTATDPVGSQDPFVSNLVRNETGMDATTKQLLFGLDGQGGFIPGAMQASENTFFNADGTPRVVEENVAGMTQDQKYAQELARQGVGMQDPYLQQAQDAYSSGIDVLGQGLASAQQRGEQALGATQEGVAEEQALRDQGLQSTLSGLGQGARLATDATSGLAGQLGNVEGIQRSAADEFGKQAGNVGAGAMGATDRFGNRLGESEQMLRGTTGGYNQSMTDQFYNPYEDAVVDQVSKDLFKQYDKGDIAARASDISRGGESAYGSRARLGAGERAEAMGRGLAEAIGGIRSRGFQQAQQAGMGEFARQKQAERAAASGLSGLAGQRLGAQQNLSNTLRGVSGDQLSAQQNLASGLGALAGQRYQAGTNLGSTLAGYGSQAGSALGGAGQAALGSAGQLAGAYGTMGGLEGQMGQQAQQAMFGLGSNLQGLGAQAQGASQQDIAQLYGLGQGQQQLNQQRLDAMRRNALTAQQAPLAQYQSLMPFMQMVPQGQFQTSTTFGQRPSPMQAGLTAGLAGLGAMGNFMRPQG